MTAPVTVALDGRGADAGAPVIVEGARLACARGAIAVRAFGEPEELAPIAELAGCEVVDSPEEIGNDVEPVAAVRSRRRASIVMAAADVAEGRSSALVSAGSTGATMTAALFALKRMRGVRRPALAVQLPAPLPGASSTLLLDCGANSEARPGDLVQFAHLGAAFSSSVLGVERPRVGLLSVGEEEKKGTPEVVEAHATLAGAGQGRGFDFVGNVEGRDLIAGSADVVVSDGFTGNVALKTIEGTALGVASGVRAAARSNPLAALGGLLLRPALGGLRRRMDPDQTGGAILLGLRGIAVVGHGSTGAEGVANAIRLAARSVVEETVERTRSQLAEAGASRGSLRESAAAPGEG